MAAKSGVSLKWGGLDKALDKVSARLMDTRPLMAAIGEALVAGTLARFEAEEDPEGKKWKPSRRALAQGGKTLTDTARLRNSIDCATTRDRVMVGAKVKYARIHQLGGKAGRGRRLNLPARPYLGFSDEDKEEVREMIALFLKKGL